VNANRSRQAFWDAIGQQLRVSVSDDVSDYVETTDEEYFIRPYLERSEDAERAIIAAALRLADALGIDTAGFKAPESCDLGDRIAAAIAEGVPPLR
jgi:hypothetical protein